MQLCQEQRNSIQNGRNFRMTSMMLWERWSRSCSLVWSSLRNTNMNRSKFHQRIVQNTWLGRKELRSLLELVSVQQVEFQHLEARMAFGKRGLIMQGRKIQKKSLQIDFLVYTLKEFGSGTMTSSRSSKVAKQILATKPSESFRSIQLYHRQRKKR